MNTTVATQTENSAPVLPSKVYAPVCLDKTVDQRSELRNEQFTSLTRAITLPRTS